MIRKTISHYPAFRDPVKRDKILEKLGEWGMSSLIKKYNKLISQGGSSLIKKCNKLIPQTGGVVYTVFDTKLELNR